MRIIIIEIAIIAILILNSVFSIYQWGLYSYNLSISIGRIHDYEGMQKHLEEAKYKEESVKQISIWRTKSDGDAEGKKLWGIKCIMDTLILLNVTYWILARKRKAITST